MSPPGCAHQSASLGSCNHMAWDKSTNYAVRDRLTALENLDADRRRDVTLLRQEVAALQTTLNKLLGFHKRDASYLEFLKAKVAAGLKK
jgi:hypothetical protein